MTRTIKEGQRDNSYFIIQDHKHCGHFEFFFVNI